LKLARYSGDPGTLCARSCGQAGISSAVQAAT
jgi:hypothetical protein